MQECQIFFSISCTVSDILPLSTLPDLAKSFSFVITVINYSKVKIIGKVHVLPDACENISQLICAVFSETSTRKVAIAKVVFKVTQGDCPQHLLNRHLAHYKSDYYYYY